MDRAEIQRRVAGFDRWHYEFDLDGVRTPISDPRTVNRHEQRARYFFDALLKVTGGTLEGHRVLDLGCNAGFWSLKAIEAGADFVLGVDGRQMHVDEAKLVFEVKGISPDRYRFEIGNIFEFNPGGDFDIVMCLGLMYHISKPVELFELMTRSGAEILVIDTVVSLLPGSVLAMHTERLDVARNAVDYETVFVPTRQAVIDLARQFGYTTVPLALNAADLTGMDDYRTGRRLSFICAKTTSLDGLSREVPPFITRAGVSAEAARLARTLRKRVMNRH